MKILITGSNGMLGQELVKALKDFDLITWKKENLNITNYDEVKEKVVKLNPDIIINAAAYTDVDGCETNREICMSVNAQGPANLARAAKKIDAVLVHYSTDYVFNGLEKNGYKEDCAKIEPINIYGESKALGEKLVIENCDKYYILRTAWLYGKNGQNFVDTMLELSKTKKELQVVNDQHGSPTYAVDLANQTRKILMDIKPKFGVFHVTNEDNCTWYEFSKEIFKLKNIKIKLKPCKSDQFPRPAKRPKYSILINTKLPSMRTWQQALKDYLN